MDTKHKPLSISEEINLIKKVDEIPNVLWKKTAEKLDSSCERGYSRMLGWSDASENVL
jgi:hypothetical protein